MNYVSSIVRILETPILRFTNNKISRTEFRVQFPQLRKKQSVTIVKLVFWGDFAYDIVNYYKVNDYILVEGYLSFRKTESNHLNNKILKQIEITVFKVYPLFLNSGTQVMESGKLK